MNTADANAIVTRGIIVLRFLLEMQVCKENADNVCFRMLSK